jgi:hypothetical protein
VLARARARCRSRCWTSERAGPARPPWVCTTAGSGAWRCRCVRRGPRRPCEPQVRLGRGGDSC